MNFERLRWGEWLAALSGVWLILLVFRAWYEVPDIDAAVTAMDAFDFEHLVFLVAGAVGILLLLLVGAERDDELSFPFGAVVAVVGLIATALAAYRIASPPADDLDAALGSYLGLLACLGVAAGGLIAARDAQAGGAPAAAGTADAAVSGDYGAGAEGAQDWSAPAAPATSGWSPAPPAPADTGWSAAPPAQDDPSRPIQAGDAVELTEGSVRFPAGTVGTVIETFGGGALIEVRDDSGNPDRVEVPSDAFRRAGGATESSDAGWSPGMPAAAAGAGAAAGAQQGQDWGFDEPSGASLAEPPAAAEPIEGPEAGEAAEPEGERPGFFARLFARKPKQDDGADETLAIEGPGVESAAEPADRPGGWESPAGASEPDYASGIPDASDSAAVEAAAPEAEAAAIETPAPEPADLASEPEAEAAEPAAEEPTPPSGEPEPPAPEPPAEPEPAAAAAEPAPADAVPAAADPEPPPEPEPAAAEPEAADVTPADGEPEAADATPAADAADEPAAPEAPAAYAEPLSSDERAGASPDGGPDGDDALAAGGAAAGGAAAAASADEPAPAKKKAAKKRRKSSAAMKTPTERPAPAGRTPEIGDEVELQVSGGKWDAGTRGTVVDSFAAGVIVEVYGEDGKAERLDLPFEAVSIVES